MYTSLWDLDTPKPDTLKISASYLGAKHGLLGTDAMKVMIHTLRSSKCPNPEVCRNTILKHFRESGMSRPVRSEAIRLHRESKMTVEQIYQDFQNREGDVPHKHTPKLAIVNWIKALKN